MKTIKLSESEKSCPILKDSSIDEIIHALRYYQDRHYVKGNVSSGLHMLEELVKRGDVSFLMYLELRDAILHCYEPYQVIWMNEEEEHRDKQIDMIVSAEKTMPDTMEFTITCRLDENSSSIDKFEEDLVDFLLQYS